MKRLFFLLFVVVLALVGCSEKPATEEIKPPRLKATLDGKRQIQTVLGTYSWEEKGSNVVADAASPNQIAQDMRGTLVPSRQNNSFIQFKGTDILKKITVYEWNDNQRGNEVKLNERLEFLLPQESGRHIYEAFVEYDKGEASYTFVVEIKENKQKEERK